VSHDHIRRPCFLPDDYRKRLGRNLKELQMRPDPVRPDLDPSDPDMPSDEEDERAA
jgi:hypothetical protein